MFNVLALHTLTTTRGRTGDNTPLKDSQPNPPDVNLYNIYTHCVCLCLCDEEGGIEKEPNCFERHITRGAGFDARVRLTLFPGFYDGYRRDDMPMMGPTGRRSFGLSNTRV